ncbi:MULTISPECIES: hypothetical protein [Bacillus cereus group]|uniref:hypothetical protein n=1 Tax=Bacillus cereus group TaxID=86661 RepID=UPI0013FDD4F7|nr:MULTISPECIES: hypothetical protein [Bacillus cereus group]
MQKSKIGINKCDNLIFTLSHLLTQKHNVIVVGKPGKGTKHYYKSTKNKLED